MFEGGFWAKSITCVKWPLSRRQKIGFQDQLLLNAGQKYCIKLPIVIKTFVLSVFEWPFYTGFIVWDKYQILICWLIY